MATKEEAKAIISDYTTQVYGHSDYDIVLINAWLEDPNRKIKLDDDEIDNPNNPNNHGRARM